MTKLGWINNEYLRNLSRSDVAEKVSNRLDINISEMEKNGIRFEGLCALLLERSNTICELSEEIISYITEPKFISLQELFNNAAYCKNRMESEAQIYKVLEDFYNKLPKNWNMESISNHFKSTLSEWNLKMPQLAIPLRAVILGKFQSPSIEKILFLLGELEVRGRLQNFLKVENANER